MGIHKKVGLSICLFFSFYMILPSYFALEISQSLPLITASRVILFICCFDVFRKNHWKLKIKRIDLSTKLYFILFIFVNVFHLYDIGMTAINRVIAIFLEQFLVYFLIISLVI